MNGKQGDLRTPEKLTPPETDLKTGTIHVCSFGDKCRILVRGDMLVIWIDGEQASMTPDQWLDLATRDQDLTGQLNSANVEIDRLHEEIADLEEELNDAAW